MLEQIETRNMIPVEKRSSFKMLLLILVLCTVYVASLPLSPNETVIYKKYERKHPTKNFIEVVEIWSTMKEPPSFTKDDEAINNFLAIDLYNQHLRSTTTEQANILPEIPNSTWRPLPQSTTTERQPFRSTRPTIRPNPMENENPDYTDILQPIHGKNNTITNDSVMISKAPKRTDDEDSTVKNKLHNMYEDYEGSAESTITESYVPPHKEPKPEVEEEEEDDEDEDYGDDYYENKFDVVENMQ